MNEHLRNASAKSFDETESYDGHFFPKNADRDGVEFSRREAASWLLFFALLLLLLLVVLAAGKYFMLNR